jgi:hypothetical protein
MGILKLFAFEISTKSGCMKAKPRKKNELS